MDKRFVIKYSVLIGIIAINIFPGGCLTWGSAPVTTYPSSSVRPYPSTTASADTMVSVNGTDYINKLKCIESDTTIDKASRDIATELRVSTENLLKTSTDGKVSIKQSDISKFTTIKNTCDFPALATTGSSMNY